MSFNKKFFTTGGIVASSGDAACSTDSVQAFGADNAFSSNIALYQLDSDGGTTNNVPDTTGNHNGTASNVTYASGYIGNAAVFNGSSSEIDLPNLGTNVSGSSPRTVSLWVNLDHYPTTGEVLSTAFYMGTAAPLSSWAISIATGGEVRVSGYNNDWITTETINTGTWTNIVCLYRGGAHETAANSDIYIDGILANKTLIAGTGTNAGALNTTNSNYSIGYFKDLNLYYFDGSIDQLRLFDKAISAEDVATLYAETSSTASNTNPLSEGSGVALYTMDYDASEAGGYYDATPTNVEFGVGGNINFGARFNGSTSSIDIATTTTTPINFTTEVFSISLWIKPQSLSHENTFLGKYGTTGNAGTHRSILMKIDTSGRFVVVENNGSSTYTQTSTGTISANTYTFFAYTRSGTTSKIYINNNSAESHLRNNTIKNGSTQELTLGGLRSGVTDFEGDLDQVRLFSSTLSDSEVAQLFAETACVYDSTTDDNYFPLADGSSDAVAYYKLDNSAEDSVGTNDGTEYNIEYRFGRFGQAAVFDGSSAIVLPNDILNTSEHSISLWFNLDDTNGIQTVLEMDYENRILFRAVSTDSNFAYIGSVGYFNHGISFSANQWYHLVITFSAGNPFKIYVDGLLSYTGENSNINAQTNDNSLGASNPLGGAGVDGKIDQVRIFSTALSSSQVSELYNEKPEVDTSNFKAVLYEGNGGTNFISNVGFQPDLVWVKARDDGHDHVLYDTVRGVGAGKALVSNAQYVEGAYDTTYGFLDTFEATGFVAKTGSSFANYTNKNNESYVGWAWKGGGEAVQNNDGTIPSNVSANVDAGFSIATYTGNGHPNSGTPEVGHGLSQTPEITMIKGVGGSGFGGGAGHWVVSSSHVPTDPYAGGLYLSSTVAYYSSINYFWSGTPTDEVVKLNTDPYVNSTNVEYVMYNWHSVAGYSKIGTYSGSGSSGNAQSVGFAPSFVVVKSTIGSTSNWAVFDNPRTGERLNWNTNGAGSPDTRVTLTSTGFEFTGSAFNNSGVDWLYMAFK